jgi:signal transduction histidine kinase
VDSRPAGELETGVYRIVQEALTNAVKHGHASHITLNLLEDEDRLSLTVADDGTGFDPSTWTEGFGLTGMGERVELLGGELGIESVVGQGTTVTVSLPVSRHDRGVAGVAALQRQSVG